MAAPTVESTEETTNYARLCRLLIDVGSDALRNIFDGIHPPANLSAVLASPTVRKNLQALSKKRVLNPKQWSLLYPSAPVTVSSKQFDITLLFVLLRNICGLSPPTTTGSWDTLPPVTDVSREADMVRVKYFRNTVYGHAEQASVDDVTFNNQWTDIRDALVRLGGPTYGVAIDKLKTQVMDPLAEEHYKDLLKQLKKDDDDVKDKIEELYAKFGGESCLFYLNCSVQRVLKVVLVHNALYITFCYLPGFSKCKLEITCNVNLHGRVQTRKDTRRLEQ